jgi:basic membrane protein A
MCLGFFTSYKFGPRVLLAFVSFSSVSFAQDESFARKRCVEVGFPAGTVGHADCVKQYLKSAGKSKSAAPKLEAKPSETVIQEPAVEQSNLPACKGTDVFKWSNCTGTKTFPSGAKYVGEFKDGKLHGRGTGTFANGNKYVGEWKDDKRNGQGTATFADGNKYVGEYKDDKRNGQGTFTFADGSMEVGEYKDGKLNGLAIKYSADGTVTESGIYKDYVLVTPKNIDPNIKRNDIPLKISFAYVGPVGDGGWTYAHDQGRKAIKKEFGDKVVISFEENVSESTDAERNFLKMVSQGNKLIFGTTFGYMEPLLKIASQNPSIKFEHATGYKQAKNLNTYDSRTYEGAYLAGIIAGGMTKTNTLGFVASIPIPEVIRNINSFTLGAQSVNPKVITKVVWVNEWYNPLKETEAAKSLVRGGADILFQSTDSPAVLQAAEKMSVRAIGWDSDMSPYSPKAHLASSVVNWGPYYVETTRKVLTGSWTGGNGSWWGVKEGAIDIVSIAHDVPTDIKNNINLIKNRLKDENFVIWKGPIFDSNGRIIFEEGEVADDEFLSGMNFYVRGVLGKVPGSK